MLLILCFPFVGPFLAFLIWRIVKWAKRTPQRQNAAMVNFVIAVCYLLPATGFGGLGAGFFALPVVILLCVHAFFFALYAEWQLHLDKTEGKFSNEKLPVVTTENSSGSWTKFTLINAAVLLGYSVFFGWQAQIPAYSDIGVPAMPEFGALVGWCFAFFLHSVFAFAVGFAIYHDRKNKRISKTQNEHV